MLIPNSLIRGQQFFITKLLAKTLENVQNPKTLNLHCVFDCNLFEGQNYKHLTTNLESEQKNNSSNFDINVDFL
jgi:hypothetical protein